MYVFRVMSNVAVLGDVPDWPIARMLGIRVIGAGLIVNRHSIESDEDGVDAGGQDGWPDMEHVHDGLDEHQEHGEYHNYNIVVSNTA